MTIEAEIKKSNMNVFRRIYMKRRQTDGDHESTWQEIPEKYIKKYGSIDSGIDDIKINFYKYSGFNFTAENTDGFFSVESDDKSFWYSYLTQYRTLVKVEAGYVDSDDTEYPTNPSLFVGLLDESLVYDENNLVNFKVNHLTKIFEEFPASKVTGIGATQSASTIIGKIRDHTDSNGVALFQKFITSGGWNISTTTNQYNLSTTGSLDGMTCWELMIALAEAENMLLHVDRLGDFYFINKTNTAASPVYHFSGLGDTQQTYGTNIVGNIMVDDNIKQVYNRVRIKYGESDTYTSYYNKEETWTWGDSSSSFKFGVRTYEYENELLDLSTATLIGDNLYDKFKWPDRLIKFKSKFVPMLDIYDYVTVTYKTIRKIGGALWGYFNWGEAVWGERLGYNINLDNTDCYIENIRHNLSDFTTSLTLREK